MRFETKIAVVLRDDRKTVDKIPKGLSLHG